MEFNRVEFKVFLLDWLPYHRFKNPACPTIYPSFRRVLVLWKKKTALSRIWTWVVESISHKTNSYIMCTFWRLVLHKLPIFIFTLGTSCFGNLISRHDSWVWFSLGTLYFELNAITKLSSFVLILYFTKCNQY